MGLQGIYVDIVTDFNDLGSNDGVTDTDLAKLTRK